MAPETTVQAPESVPETAARWEDFVDVFVAPRAVFRRRANDSWWVPLLVLCALSTALYYVFLPVQAVLQENAMLNNPNITPEAMEAARRMGPTMRVVSGIFTPVFVAIFTLILGLVSWIAGKVTSIDLPFRRALTITALVSFLAVVQQLVAGVLMSVKLRAGGELDPIRDYSFGLLRFIPTSELNAGVIALLSRIDLFAFWQFGWFAIALIAAANAPKGAAWLAASVVWLAGALPFLFQAMAAR